MTLNQMLPLFILLSSLIIATLSIPTPADVDLDITEDIYVKDSESLLPLQRAITYDEPILPLEFQERAKKKPKKKNLRVTRLLKKMGVDFNPQWMSVEAPKDGVLVQVKMSESQMAELVEQVTSLNLEEELKAIVGGEQEENETDLDSQEDEKKTIVDKKSIAIFQQWLVRKSSCPVTFEWEDLGEYFWPRWIRKGRCNSGKSSEASSSTSEGCSWPLGMQCVPAHSQTLHILRWHCKRRRVEQSDEEEEEENGGRRRSSVVQSKFHCKWYKVPYPVTNSCKCACQ